MQKTVFLALSISVVVFCLVPLGVKACTCGPTPFLELFADANYAFVGTSIARFDANADAKLISGGDPIEYTFVVEMDWKDSAADTLIIESRRDGAACGYTFDIGTQYLVLANDRNGCPTTSRCSGNSVLMESLAARYLLPEPTAVVQSAVWPAIDRNGLLALLQTDDCRQQWQVAQLLADDVTPVEYQNLPPHSKILSLVRLILAEPTQSTEILISNASASHMASDFIELSLLSQKSESITTRAAAMESLGILAKGEVLYEAMKRGFLDPEESVQFAAHKVLFFHYADLSIEQANEHVESFISSIDYGPNDLCWIGIHQLRYFPDQKDLILPYVRAMADTSSIKIVQKTAQEVYDQLCEE